MAEVAGSPSSPTSQPLSVGPGPGPEPILLCNVRVVVLGVTACCCLLLLWREGRINYWFPHIVSSVQNKAQRPLSVFRYGVRTLPFAFSWVDCPIPCHPLAPTPRHLSAPQPPWVARPLCGAPVRMQLDRPGSRETPPKGPQDTPFPTT